MPAFRSPEHGSQSLLSLRPGWALSRATRRGRRKDCRWWRGERRKKEKKQTLTEIS